jgi:hypothetical protein
MATPTLDESEFLLASCATCGREVLAYVDFAEDGSEQRRCLHCDADLGVALRLAGTAELEEAGYAVTEARTCGNGGGCSAGGCGMRATH